MTIVPPSDAAGFSRIAFVHREFPSLTATFHYREFQRLAERAGLTVEAYALKRPLRCAKEAESALQRTHYLPPLASASAFRVILWALLRTPSVMTTLLGLAARARPRNKERGPLGALVFGLRGLQLAGTLRGDPPALLHAQFATENATIAMMAAKALGIPFSMAVHSPYTLYRHSALLRYKVGKAAFVTAISVFAADKLAQLCGPAITSKVHLLRCGLEMSPFAGFQRAPHSPPLVLSVGSLIQLKGHSDLVDACARLRAKGMALRCEIIGEGPCRRALEKQICDLGLSQTVVLAGSQPAEMVRKRLKEATVFCLASCIADDGDMDGIPVALMEAMAAGVPCVSTRVSGIPELDREPEGRDSGRGEESRRPCRCD